MKTTNEKVWSVYVDGNEVNSHYLTKDQALELADEYAEDGYETVAIRNHTNGKEELVK